MTKVGDYTLHIRINGLELVNSPYIYISSGPAADISIPSSVVYDVPDMMFPGLPYSFQIQGRDQYLNYMVESHLDSLLPAVYTKVGYSNVQIEVEISESDYSGIYDVIVNFPVATPSGTYLLQLNGVAVPDSEVTVLVCSNDEAFSAGLVTTPID